jgi:hypothetical protein
MISLILGEWLWINTFIGMILYSSTRRICNRVNWQLENEIGSIDGCFIYTTCCDQSKNLGLNWTSIDSNSSLESIFQLIIFTQTIEKVKTHRDLERYICGLGTCTASTVEVGVKCTWKLGVK